MSSKVLLSVAVITGFTVYCFNRGKNALAAKGEAKQDLTRWEGEGGNVPQVATPSPASIPQTSVPPASIPQTLYPGNGSSAQH